MVLFNSWMYDYAKENCPRLTVLDENTPKRLKWAGWGLLGMIAVMLAWLAFASNVLFPIDTIFVRIYVAFVSISLVVLFYMYTIVDCWYEWYYRNVCKALAGIECGVFHCADDLRFHLDLPQEVAVAVIDGKYDHLLSAHLVCEYIGRKEVHDIE